MKHIDTLKTVRCALLAALVIGITAFTSGALANEKAPEVKKGNFIKGAALWANTCVRCHNMRDPNELTDKQWKVAVSHMRIRAGLTGQDARDILAFLQQTNTKKDEK
ncbi:MAG: cytochrome c [Verrucomicrobia bacterium]|nr:cytochrome c [Verrucomicrobiota bacterium]